MAVTKHGHQLPREAVESASLEILKNLAGYGPEQRAPADPDFSRRWDWTTSRDALWPQLFWDAVIL